MSTRSSKAFELMQQRIFAIRNKSSNFKNKPMPNVTQVQMTVMALADVLGIPMIEMIDKILEKEP